jgi:hypothetical protein
VAFLCGIIDSDINHLVESSDNRLGRRLAAPAGGDLSAIRPTRNTSTEPNPLVMTADQDWQSQFHEAAVKELKGEDFLVKLLECIEAEITEPQEIAELLGTTVDHVNNEKKKLRRRLDSLYSRLRSDKLRTRK